MAGKITPQNALKLSAWLAVHEPKLFRQLLVNAQKLQRSPLGRLGLFGDNGDAMDVITVSAPADTYTPVTPDPTLQDVSIPDVGISIDASDAITAAVSAPPAIDSSIADSSQTSGGFWSSIGAGIAGAAGAVGKLAGALVSPQTVQAASTAASAYFNAQARTAQAQLQNAAVQAQLSRVYGGAAPAPITYTRDPVTGALVPVYQSNAGAQPLTPSVLSRLTTSTGMSPTLLIGGGIAALIVISLLAAR